MGTKCRRRMWGFSSFTHAISHAAHAVAAKAKVAVKKAAPLAAKAEAMACSHFGGKICSEVGVGAQKAADAALSKPKASAPLKKCLSGVAHDEAVTVCHQHCH